MTATAASVSTRPVEPARPELDVTAVLARLAAVPDPEIPTVSIVELGMIGEVDVEPDAIRIELLPTFVGCPALEVIRDAVAERLAPLAARVTVDVSFATPWTSDRISPAGREKLRRSGFAPPPHLRTGRALPVMMGAGAHATTADCSFDRAGAATEAVTCPYCGSPRTTLESIFGPTQCRSIHHCPDCRQPFEAFKPI